MLIEPSDMHIAARWTLPMTGSTRLLREHTLVMRDGRILDLLPSSSAAERYSPRVSLVRPRHLLMPGLVNARTRIGPSVEITDPVSRSDEALLSIASLLRSGVTAFGDIGPAPAETARAAAQQGLRAVIGLPLDDRPSPWARNAAEYLTRAIRLRDEYKGHPSISTAFALLRLQSQQSAALERIGTLAAETETTVMVTIGEQAMAHTGCGDLTRLQRAGLLTPALAAACLESPEAQELELAQCAGIGVVQCLASRLARGRGIEMLEALRPLRTALGTDAEVCGTAYELWSEVKLFALHGGYIEDPIPALAAATRGGAAVLGLEDETGTLEAGKWADLCCIDMEARSLQPDEDPLRQMVLAGARDWVSDVWVAGRQLLSEGRFTRLDWTALAGRLEEPA